MLLHLPRLDPTRRTQDLAGIDDSRWTAQHGLLYSLFETLTYLSINVSWICVTPSVERLRKNDSAHAGYQ